MFFLSKTTASSHRIVLVQFISIVNTLNNKLLVDIAMGIDEMYVQTNNEFDKIESIAGLVLRKYFNPISKLILFNSSYRLAIRTIHSSHLQRNKIL